MKARKLDVAIIDCGGGNLKSVEFALQRLGVTPKVTNCPRQIKSAERVILPGVGRASTAMQRIEELGIKRVIQQLEQPVLGICLGMQLLFESSEEDQVECLGLIPGEVKALSTQNLRVPHLGWNQLKIEGSNPLLNGIANDAWVYFVHSYFAKESEYTLASCNYGMRFSAMVKKDNRFGCQFHPERSGKTGQTILKNFLEETWN